VAGRGLFRRPALGQEDLGDPIAFALAQQGLLPLAADLEVNGGVNEHLDR
jgi:hypothetical protein